MSRTIFYGPKDVRAIEFDCNREDTQQMSQPRSIGFRGTQRRRDEEQIMTKETSHMKPPMHKQRRITTKEPPWNGQKNTTGDGG